MHKCPWCDGHMVLREGSLGKFYGCSNYPDCTATASIDIENSEPLDFNNGEEFGVCIRCGEKDYLSENKLCNYCQHIWDND
ncbi:topoisomerase DNA-binding C4 zinc finger domain-containing protein [Paraclostridium bifermentans]|uniref:topoisomerase DNA-binding C4 zinc finger domain-containing protein n=1 Tax=Paraclostridium bifermentans TaxID=1490 RepID=UPI00189C48F7|nr:topoisomerase DNA-binding C4 zinc finger domain-containing protein [Paraclostridium bifermentans]